MKNPKTTIQKIKGKVSSAQYINVLENLENLGDKKAECLDLLKYKSPFLSFILALLFGPLGADRFYQSKTKFGLIKILLTLLAGAGVYTIFFSPWKEYLYILGDWVYVLWGAVICFAFAFISWYILDIIIAAQSIYDENYYKIIDKLEECVNVEQAVK